MVSVQLLASRRLKWIGARRAPEAGPVPARVSATEAQSGGSAKPAGPAPLTATQRLLCEYGLAPLGALPAGLAPPPECGSVANV